MKVTDLMVGDWVMNACDAPRKVYELVQDQVTYELEGGGLNTAHCNQLYPIPLTEEILVKNGFEKFAESQTNFDYTDNDIHLEYWIGDGVFRYYTAEIHYVHQLQHLLRLCGIEKEIAIMSKREKDFIEAAYNNDRESSKQEQQFFVEGCEHGYQYALQHPHWIPVEEGLPPLHYEGANSTDFVLIYDGGDVLIAYYNFKEKKWYNEQYGALIIPATHWMPIVPPRKEE